MNISPETEISGAPDHLKALLRHFADLRDGTHGAGAVSRADKEALYVAAVGFLEPFARQVLEAINATLLLGRGVITASGVTRAPDGGLSALWRLSWSEQVRAGVSPVTLEAFFGSGFHHPHLRGATVGVWPLNVFSEADAAAELATLRAIAAADLHNLVFQSSYRIIPAMVCV